MNDFNTSELEYSTWVGRSSSGRDTKGSDRL